MSKPVVSLPPSPPWHWPVDVTRYDRSPDLDEVERAELKRVMREIPFQLRPSTKECLHRLLSPLQDVFTVTHLSPDICHETVRVMVVAEAPAVSTRGVPQERRLAAQPDVPAFK